MHAGVSAWGSGVSFVAGLLAAWVGQAFSEEASRSSAGDSYFYRMRHRKTILYRDFYPFHRLVAGRKNIRGLANMEQGINWILLSGDAGGVTGARLEIRCSLCTMQRHHRLFDCSGMMPD